MINELRIGNYIIGTSCLPVEGTRGIHKVTSLELYAETIHDSGNFTPMVNRYKIGRDWYLGLEDIEGIPLTPELLEKCGFGNKSYDSDYYFGRYELILGGQQRTLYPSVHGESGLEAYGEQVKYLHQLQNLYYALTGTELPVNL